MQNELSFRRAVFEMVYFSGRMFDKNGNMNDWWSTQSSDAFMEHSQCMVDQYSQFSLDGKHVSDRQSQGCCALCGCGAGIAQWLERRTRDWKVAGLNPCWNGGRIFFSRVDFLC